MKIDFEGPAHGDHGFRSRLELEVAGELDEHFVDWSYEVPVVMPDGHQIRYLPDFTIHTANGQLELPSWVEAKPQQFLYDLRDTLGVTRRAGDKFSGVIDVRSANHDVLKSMGVEELWKPKLLAEMTGESVLVVGGVGGSSRLSVQMNSDSIQFRRDHPFVNWAGVVKRREVDRQRMEAKQRQQEWERERAQRQQEWEARRTDRLYCDVDTTRKVMQHKNCGAPRFASRCCGCGTSTVNGSLHKVEMLGGGSQWMVVCLSCQAAVA